MVKGFQVGDLHEMPGKSNDDQAVNAGGAPPMWNEGLQARNVIVRSRMREPGLRPNQFSPVCRAGTNQIGNFFKIFHFF